MTAFEFDFEVNKTYLNSATHPVTLPKRYYPHIKKHIPFSRLDVNIVAEGEYLKGWIYHGCAGFGPYYQLRMNNHEFAKLPQTCVNTRRLSVQVRRGSAEVSPPIPHIKPENRFSKVP